MFIKHVLMTYIYEMNIYCVCVHARMQVNKLREQENLKEWYSTYFLPDLKSFLFPVNISRPLNFFPTRKENKEKEVFCLNLGWEENQTSFFS